jgi:hypothetical protein
MGSHPPEELKKNIPGNTFIDHVAIPVKLGNPENQVKAYELRASARLDQSRERIRVSDRDGRRS